MIESSEDDQMCSRRHSPPGRRSETHYTHCNLGLDYAQFRMLM